MRVLTSTERRLSRPGVPHRAAHSATRGCQTPEPSRPAATFVSDTMGSSLSDNAIFPEPSGHDGQVRATASGIYRLRGLKGNCRDAKP